MQFARKERGRGHDQRCVEGGSGEGKYSLGKGSSEKENSQEYPAISICKHREMKKVHQFSRSLPKGQQPRRS